MAQTFRSCCLTDLDTKVGRERGLHDQPTLRSDSLLTRRPHFRLLGNELFFMASKEPHRRCSEAEVRFWDLIQQPQSVKAIQEACGEDAESLIHEFLRNDFCELIEPTFPSGRRRVLVIEPHADDAALSVGGVMWLRRLECVFVVATIASRSNHTLYYEMGLDHFDIEEVSDIRRRESELFVRMIGGDHLSVGLTDAALRYRDANWTADYFRRHRMSIRTATSRTADDEEKKRWVDAVRRLLTDVPSAEVWIPLGGPHADHMLTIDACCEVFQSDPSLAAGRTWRVYQDVPYFSTYSRCMTDAIEAWKGAGVVMERELIPIDAAYDRKLRLTSVYASQNIAAMRKDIEASARAYRPAAEYAEILWTLRRLPSNFQPSAIMAAKMAEPDRQEAVARWVSANRESEAVRVLLLTPTGNWATDLKLLCRAFPRARFEVYVTHAAVAEVGDAPSDRVQVRRVMNGTQSWILLSLRFALAMKASPTVFFAGDRRVRAARLLSGLWFASDTLVVASMDSLMNSLRARRDSFSLDTVN
jgi:LmbE family N-acetylglucosaminyl deacetylase